ncbi:MAG: CBS domain-containing protein [Armatimonadota bacterium]
MQARDMMTPAPTCCTLSDTVQTAARHMLEKHCGLLPVVDNQQDRRILGVITDRDITCRVVAPGKDCVNTPVQEAMSTDPVWTVSPSDSLETVEQKMEEGQVRRIPVVDASGRVEGIIATADLALEAESQQDVAEVIERISEPTNMPRAA